MPADRISLIGNDEMEILSQKYGIFNRYLWLRAYREIQEELAISIQVGEYIDTIEYDYPSFHLSMDCFWAKIEAGDIILNEAEDARWLEKDELYSVEWLPADLGLISLIIKDKCW